MCATLGQAQTLSDLKTKEAALRAEQSVIANRLREQERALYLEQLKANEDLQTADQRRTLLQQQVRLQTLLQKFGKSHPQVQAVEAQMNALQNLYRQSVARSVEVSKNRAMSLLDALTAELRKRVVADDDEQKRKVDSAIAILKEVIATPTKQEKRIEATEKDKSRIEQMRKALQRTEARMIEEQARMEAELQKIRQAHSEATLRLQETYNVLKTKEVEADLVESSKKNALKERVDSMESSVDEIKAMLKQLLSEKEAANADEAATEE